MKILPQELEYWVVLPLLRKEIVKIMLNKGLKQKDVASLLGLTRAAISQYINDKRARNVKLSKEIKKMIVKASEGIMQGKVSLNEELTKISNYIKAKGELCKIHKAREKIENCKICLEK